MLEKKFIFKFFKTKKINEIIYLLLKKKYALQKKKIYKYKGKDFQKFKDFFMIN